MDQRNNLRDATSRLGLGGDTTYGPQSLNDFTNINSQFLNLINGEPSHSSPKPSHSRNQVQSSPEQIAPTSSQSPVKRNPEDIVRQLQINHKRRPLIENQKTIETFRSENLELRIQLHRFNKLLKQHSIDPEDANSDELERGIVEELSNRIEKLQKQLDDRDREKKNQSRERGCQTNLDGMNMEKLVEASVKLKKQSEEQRKLQANRGHQAIQCDLPQPTQNKQHSIPDKRSQQQNSVMTQIHYPIVTLPKQQATSSKTPMCPDEKKILEMLFTLDGKMTTVYDKLKAVADSHLY